MLKICKGCGIEFDAYNHRLKFHNNECYQKYRKEHMAEYQAGCYKKGHYPKYKIPKGSHVSFKTEFKKGHMPANWVKVGTIKIRTSNKTQTYRQRWIKIAEPNKWQEYNRYVWIKYNGKIPEGMIITFKDGNPLNDKKGNLQLLTRAENINKNREILEAFRKDIIPESIKSGRITRID